MITFTRTHGLVAAGVAGIATLALVLPANAAGSDTVIRYRSTDPVNTDLDLGDEGFSAGDVQVFVNKVVRNGTQIGYEAGECRIVEATENSLKASCHSTVVLAGGTLTTQGVFVEDDFQAGPTGTIRQAITGGTGDYRGATGESVGEFIPGTNTLKITIRLN